MANMCCPFLNAEIDHYLTHVKLGTVGWGKKICN